MERQVLEVVERLVERRVLEAGREAGTGGW